MLFKQTIFSPKQKNKAVQDDFFSKIKQNKHKLPWENRGVALQVSQDITRYHKISQVSPDPQVNYTPVI